MPTPSRALSCSSSSSGGPVCGGDACVEGRSSAFVEVLKGRGEGVHIDVERREVAGCVCVTCADVLGSDRSKARCCEDAGLPRLGLLLPDLWGRAWVMRFVRSADCVNVRLYADGTPPMCVQHMRGGQALCCGAARRPTERTA